MSFKNVTSAELSGQENIKVLPDIHRLVIACGDSLGTIDERKRRHLEVSLRDDVQSMAGPWFQDVQLVHRCLPEMNLGDVSTKTSLFSHHLSAPLIISAITGGTEEGKAINRNLSLAAEELGIGVGVGSQRIAIEDPTRESSFRVVREAAPTALVLGNLGCPQLGMGYGTDEARRCVRMIDADVLALHMNPLQESIQVRGEARYSGILGKIQEIVEGVGVPIVAKETGAGVAFEDAVRLEKTGVIGIDVSGLGGTSWSAVEQRIAMENGDMSKASLGDLFSTWGIRTAVSIVEVKRSTRMTVIASGGVRTGIDMAKAIALGADAVGVAQPLVKPAQESSDRVVETVNGLLAEFRTAMFLTGARNVEELRKVPVVLVGGVAEWLERRGFDPDSYARR